MQVDLRPDAARGYLLGAAEPGVRTQLGALALCLSGPKTMPSYLPLHTSQIYETLSVCPLLFGAVVLLNSNEIKWLTGWFYVSL